MEAQPPPAGLAVILAVLALIALPILALWLNGAGVEMIGERKPRNRMPWNIGGPDPARLPL